MKKTILILSLCACSLFAQRNFSNKIVKYNDCNFYPYLKGAVEKKVLETYNFENLSYDEKQAALLTNRINKIISIFENCDLLNPPQGLTVKISAYSEVQKSILNQKPRLQAIIEFYPFCFVQGEDGKPTTSIETANSFSMYINNPLKLVGMPILDDIYLQPVKREGLPNYSVYETDRGEIGVLTNIKRPLYVPVSQEEYIKCMIKECRKQIDEASTEKQEDGANKSIRERFDEEKEQRHKDFEKAYSELLKVDVNAAEELKKTFKETEKTLSQEIYSNEDYTVSKSDIIDSGNKIWEEKIEALNKELNSLSPAERKQQAFYSNSVSEVSASGLVPKDYAGAEPLIRINKELFDLSKPQSEIQLIVFSGSELIPSLYKDGKDAYNLEKWIFVELCKRDEVWLPIINLIAK
jgi:hypothetical protein